MLYLWFFFALVVQTLAVCPPVNTAINCSFETTEDCYGAYKWQDEHGLAWLPKTGAIDHYLDSSPENMQYVLSTGSRGRYSQYMSMPGVDDPRIINQWTELVSSSFIISGQGCLYFLYHNSVCGKEYDPSLSSFQVLLRPKLENGLYDATKDILLNDYPCVNNSLWIYERLAMHSFTGTFKIVFSARHHEVPEQMIAVDRVRFINGPCSTQEDLDYTKGECDFEDINFCGYRSKYDAQSGIYWKVVSRDMFHTSKFHYAPVKSSGVFDSRTARNMMLWSQYVADTQTPGSQAPAGKFLLVWGEDLEHDTVRSLVFKSPKFRIKEVGCLSVVYFNGRYAGENNGTDALTVVVADNQENGTVIQYTFPTSLSKKWLETFIPLTKGRYSITFTAKISLPYGNNPYDIIGLDDIEIHQKSCDEVRCDDKICDINKTGCSGHGTCIGSGRKHYSCACTMPYLGKVCDYNPEQIINQNRGQQIINRNHRQYYAYNG